MPPWYLFLLLCARGSLDKGSLARKLLVVFTYIRIWHDTLATMGVGGVGDASPNRNIRGTSPPKSSASICIIDIYIVFAVKLPSVWSVFHTSRSDSAKSRENREFWKQKVTKFRLRGKVLWEVTGRWWHASPPYKKIGATPLLARKMKLLSVSEHKPANLLLYSKPKLFVPTKKFYICNDPRSHWNINLYW